MQGFLAVPRGVFTFRNQQLAEFPQDGISALVYAALANEANWCDSTAPLPREGVPLKRGQILICQRQFADALGISRQTFRTSLRRLVDRRKINPITNPKDPRAGTIITIVDYEKLFLPEETSQPNQQPGANPEPTQSQPSQDKETKRQGDKDRASLLSAEPTTAPQIAKVWNENHDWMPRVTDMSEDRKAKVRRRWKGKPDEAYWRDIIQRLAKSSFARRGGWATFDWLITNDTNHRKVAEGNYDDRGDQAGGKPKITKLHAGMFPE